MEKGRESERLHTTYGVVGKVSGCKGSGAAIDELLGDVVTTLLLALAGARGNIIGIEERQPKGVCGQVVKEESLSAVEPDVARRGSPIRIREDRKIGPWLVR
jgi:hypothetical protein